MTETAPEMEPEVSPQAVTEVAPEAVPEVVPEVVTATAPEVVAEVLPEATPQATQDTATQTTDQDDPQSAASGADTATAEVVSSDAPVEVASVPPAVADPPPTVATLDVATAPVEGMEGQASDGQDVALADPSGIEDAPTEVQVPQVSLDAPGIVAPAVETATAPPVLIADAEGVRVLQPARASESAPEVLRTVALDTISYDDSGEVTVAGRATSGIGVRVYLDNDPIAEAAISAIGTWSTVLRDVQPGVYTLRVDQLDADGAVLSRIETPFLREERETIAAVMAEDTEREDFSVAVRTVQPGNTLWAIARDRYGQGILYVAVFEANKDLIRDPDLIYPGQIFRLPELEDGQIAE
jgi:nucleoid-associated protein YgaU